MKEYEVTFECISYVTIWVDAESKDAAETEAWRVYDQEYYTEGVGSKICQIDEIDENEALEL